MSALVPAEVAVASGFRHLGGALGTTMTGGGVAALKYNERHPGKFEYAYKDLDFFHSSMEAMMSNTRLLLSMGAIPLDQKEERKLRRWLLWGNGDWHTSSIRLKTHDQIEFNLVYKTIDKHALRTEVEQVNSFDFSNVGGSFNMKTGAYHNLADYYWPDKDPDEEFMFPDREAQWSTGSIGRHQGLRQAGRYATYVSRGYNLQQHCKQPLVEGYRIAGTHYLGEDSDELQFYAEAYLRLAGHIEDDEIDVLLDAYKLLNPYSQVQSLLAALP